MALRYAAEGHVAVVTLARQEALNAVDLELWSALSEATARIESDPDIWAAIITGEGRAFCAGADLKSTVPALFEGRIASDNPPMIWRGQRLTKPLIAAINGMALGIGLELVLACDIRIAVEGARLGLPEVTLSLIPGAGGTQRLPRELPWAIAAKMILTGQPIAAEEALRYGLISAVVPRERLMEEAHEVAQALCRVGPLAARAAKRAMLEGASMTLEAGLALEAELFVELGRSSDAQEGLAAFVAKRPPAYRGE